MHTLLHWLFGWHYIWIKYDFVGWNTKYMRVKKNPINQWQGYDIWLHDIFITDDGVLLPTRIKVEDWVPITFSMPEKTS